MNRLKQIHGYNLKRGIDHNQTKNLILQILQIPNIPYAHNVFNYFNQPSTFLYNNLIQAYSSHKHPHKCISLYSQMCLQNCPPNEQTFMFLFAASASLPTPLYARILHTHFVKSGFEPDVFASTALVDMYAKLRLMGSARKLFDEMTERDVPTWNALIAGYSRCGDMEGALRVFRLMEKRNVVSWTAMVSGYSQNGLYAKALKIFLKMEEEGVRANEVTISSVLPACANLGALEVGERIDVYARQNGLLKNLYVSNALLEMYARCGKIDVAMRVFDEMGERRNQCSWNSMIMGLAVHGRSNEALRFYDQMLEEGITPDDVTFVALLLACTHGGMVSNGRHLFKSMTEDFNLSKKLEHYGCMVDLLGRAGELREAYELIMSMPMKPDSVIWGTLLGACSFHKNVEFAEIAAQSLFELEPWNPGNYVILSNIYAATNRWDGVAKLRKMMKGSQITKAAGYSFIEIGGEIHKFIVEDSSHPRSDLIYMLLNKISAEMKVKAYSDSELEELCVME